MPYTKSIYDNRAIPDFARAAIDNIEGALHVGYHAVCVGICAQHMEMFKAEAVFWPFFEGRLDTVQDFGINQAGYHLYTSLGAAQELHLWDTPPENVGVMRCYVFNGTDEYLVCLDQDFFTVEAQNTFSVGAWVYMNEASASCILSKWDETDTAEKREWKLSLSTSEYPGLTIYDETNNAAIGREDQTALRENEWHYIVGTYHGGTDAADIHVYVDGVQSDDADIADDVGFASMVNQTTVVRCGSFEDDGGDEADLFDGKMWGPFFTLHELSTIEVWNLYQLGKAALDLDLIAGMPD